MHVYAGVSSAEASLLAAMLRLHVEDPESPVNFAMVLVCMESFEHSYGSEQVDARLREFCRRSGSHRECSG